MNTRVVSADCLDNVRTLQAGFPNDLRGQIWGKHEVAFHRTHDAVECLWGIVPLPVAARRPMTWPVVQLSRTA
jgi:hypothetical protein